MFEVCVIGHVTRDIIAIKGRPAKSMPGGTAYYTAMAFRSLGHATAVVTRVAPGDEDALLEDLRGAGVHVFCRPSASTTLYENTYPDDTLDVRRQEVGAVADGFSERDVADVRAAAYHVGTSTSGDLAAGLLGTLAARGAMLSLDVQGLLRKIEGRRVRLVDWPDKGTDFAGVDILKADLDEARILTGEESPEGAARRLAEFGPNDVIVSLGSGGSVVLGGGRLHRIPAVAPERLVDATGCGDTYMAGYVSRRLKGEDAERAGRFAAALATLKLERSGPFAGAEADVEARLRGGGEREGTLSER